jgi:hypothetical protein
MNKSTEDRPPNPERIALHQAAIAEEKAKDRRWLEFHKKAMDLLFAGGEIDQDLKRQALERLQFFKDRQLGHPDWIAMWHELLDSPEKAAKSAILAENEGGHCLRKNTPLSFLVPLVQGDDSTQRRREMVEQVNANQRLEGYEPDEQLAQLQARFIAGDLSTTDMLRMLTDYAREIQNKLKK